jgi:peptidoglycan lytic transglycosylase B
VKKCVLIISFLIGILCPCVFAGDAPDSSFLENILVDKGFDQSFVNEMLNDPRIYYDNEIIIKNLYQPIGAIQPAQKRAATDKRPTLYIDAKYIDLGREFMKDQEELLALLEYQYGVSPGAVTAILIVESKLGKYYEKYYAFNALFNLAACIDPDYLSIVIESNKEKFPELANEETALLAIKKSEWALNELCELMKLARAIDMDPFEIKGSYAGAIGPAQFIPSSFLKFGIDGDFDGVRDPFNMTDAMASIANYLKLAGWDEEAGEERLRKAIWNYNHSQVYVNTVMMLYQELSKG